MSFQPVVRAVFAPGNLKSVSSLRFQKVSSEQRAANVWKPSVILLYHDGPSCDKSHLVGTAKSQDIGDLHGWQQIVQEDLNRHFR